MIWKEALDKSLKFFRHGTSSKPHTLSRDDQKKVRSMINPSKICGLCLFDYEHQTVDGTMLCGQCYEERKKEIEEECGKD